MSWAGPSRCRLRSRPPVTAWPETSPFRPSGSTPARPICSSSACRKDSSTASSGGTTAPASPSTSLLATTRSTSSSTRWSTRDPESTKPIPGRSRPAKRSSWRPLAGAPHTIPRRAMPSCSAIFLLTWESTMSISDLRQDVQSHLVAFLWSQWAQIGVLAATNRKDRWAADPEALLLLTFEVGREEPRLLDEVLDWLAVNERLVSIQRLRNLARDEEDRALVEAVVGWLGERRRRARLEARATAGASTGPGPFFRNSRLP